MEIALERDAGRSGRPVYQQIADHIRTEVEAERLSAGSRLPPIRDLARRLGVNRDTVALAYEALASAGIVESAVGRGTFVAGAEEVGSGATGPFEPMLSPAVERLLEFERARPRFGSASDAIPMHALIPDPALYPAESFRKALNRVLQQGGPELLLYGTPQGHAGLRSVLSRRLAEASLPIDADELVLCHGASQGISLALRLFVQPGDAIAVEDPTYNNVLAAALALGVRVVPVPMGEDGVDLAALERTFGRPDVKAFYTIPTFHNPLGTSSSMGHRRALARLARRAGVPVIEDGYEMDLRFAGRAIPPLAGIDTSGVVVHLFSFSKSLFPGARVGAISARGRLVDALLALKQAADLSDALPLQAALAEFAGSGEYDRHLSRLRRVMRSRHEALQGALEREMPDGTRWTEPEGGYQVWVELPETIDTADLLADAVSAGVLFAPGSQFHHDGRASRCLRLTFAMADEAALEQGVSRLAGVVREHLKSEPRAAARVHI